ncbi:MAG TPA: division/cell wall cluster transcriptional repressor MraZ [Gaiellaceae bacterium]|jgi:transcriptional regulator MraZ|nr:division/cell wall cluster transcriptional repressor MraZ [Gaiellaceae bacterium]
MLLGEYEHTIDDKNRLTLPARFRQSFAAGVVVARGIDQCLDVYTREGWEATMASRLAGLDPFTRENRQLRRALFSSGSEADVDKQGRVTIPAGLLGKASLARDVVVVGVGDHLEVWDRKAWKAEIEDVEGRVELVAERVAARER